MPIENMIDKYTKAHSRDMIILSMILALSVIFSIYQFHLHHYGASLLFAFISFVNTMLLLVSHTLYKKAKELFKQSEEMVEEMLRQLEAEGKI